MKRPLVFCLGIVLLGGSAWLGSSYRAEAIPTSFFGNGNFIGPIIPAHPRFNANLTTAFLDRKRWNEKDFPGPWVGRSVTTGIEHHRMTAMPILFGAVPDSVVARHEEDSIREIVITYLDAGTYFPYRSGGEKTHAQREAGSDRRAEFDSHWHRLEADLRERLEAGCGPGRQSVSGKSDRLRSVHLDYRWEDFRLRLVRREGHSIALRLSLADQPPPPPVAREVTSLDRRGRQAWLAAKVGSNERGETVITGIPTFDQGFTPYCGVHSLAMVAHFHGLRLLPGELAAGAEFANTGSARGSRILELYEAVGEELELDLKKSSRFDARRAERAIQAGLPLIAWRRVSEAREQAHADFASAMAEEPHLALPRPSAASLATLPGRTKKGSPSHASVIHGIDLETGTVVYLEPWGEEALERRMSLEELEASAYAVFYLEP